MSSLGLGGQYGQYGGMHVPEDREQALVETPYGRGVVIRTRKGAKGGKVIMREIALTDWVKPEVKKGPQRPSMLYSPKKFPSVTPEVGSTVTTTFGRGKVVGLRHEKAGGKLQTVVVRISSWRLAGRNTPTCYLSPESVQVLRTPELYDMNVYDKVEHAQELKKQAAVKFAAKKYEVALNLYAKAVDAVRYVQHTRESSNELRADLLVVMITCCNNAATCCLQLHHWDRAQKFGRNALVLLDALLEKKGNSKIHELLNKEGITDSQLFGTWKVKSCLVVARGLAEQHESQLAMDSLKKGLDVISTYKKEGDSLYQQLAAQEKETRRLYAACKDRLKFERQKEKKRAMAMFGGSEEKKDSEKREDDNAPTIAARPLTPLPAAEMNSHHAAINGKPNHVARHGERGDAKRRVSFADGSRPGDINEDDDDEPSFLDENKEAMLIVGGAIIGYFIVAALWRRTR